MAVWRCSVGTVAVKVAERVWRRQRRRRLDEIPAGKSATGGRRGRGRQLVRVVRRPDEHSRVQVRRDGGAALPLQALMPAAVEPVIRPARALVVRAAGPRPARLLLPAVARARAHPARRVEVHQPPAHAENEALVASRGRRRVRQMVPVDPVGDALLPPHPVRTRRRQCSTDSWGIDSWIIDSWITDSKCAKPRRRRASGKSSRADTIRRGCSRVALPSFTDSWGTDSWIIDSWNIGDNWSSAPPGLRTTRATSSSTAAGGRGYSSASSARAPALGQPHGSHLHHEKYR